MSINMSKDQNIPTDTESYYEMVASQEEIYLEETEEELRAILHDTTPSQDKNITDEAIGRLRAAGGSLLARASSDERTEAQCTYARVP